MALARFFFIMFVVGSIPVGTFCSLIDRRRRRYRRGHNLMEQIKDAKLHAGDWKLSHPPARREDPVAALEKELLAARKTKGAAALR